MPRKKPYASPFRKKPQKVTLAQLNILKMSRAGMQLLLTYHPKADRTALREEIQRQLTPLLNRHQEWIEFENMKKALLVESDLRRSGKPHSHTIIAKKLGFPPRYIKKLLSERMRRHLPPGFTGRFSRLE